MVWSGDYRELGTILDFFLNVSVFGILSTSNQNIYFVKIKFRNLFFFVSKLKSEDQKKKEKKCYRFVNIIDQNRNKYSLLGFGLTCSQKRPKTTIFGQKVTMVKNTCLGQNSKAMELF